MHSLLSVLIPAYNHEKYIAECVESVMAQDWPRMELIILDDGSKDGTWARIGELERKARESGKFERVKVATQENQGTCMTLNRLCGMAKGDVVAIIASDDKYLPGAFSAMMKPMLVDDSIGVVAGQNELMDGDSRRCYWDCERNSVYNPVCAVWKTFNDYLTEKCGASSDDERSFGKYERLVRGNHIPNGYLIRATCLRQVLPFREEAPLEDWWLHLQLSKITRYRSVEQHVFCYRWHSGNTIRQDKKMEQYAAKTLEWEYEHVMQLDNAEWKDAIQRATHYEKVVFSLFGLVAIHKVRKLNQKLRVLRIGKLRWVYHARTIGVTP